MQSQAFTMPMTHAQQLVKNTPAYQRRVLAWRSLLLRSHHQRQVTTKLRTTKNNEE
jgi:hypothetical protein